MIEFPTVPETAIPYLRVALIAVVALVAWISLRVAVRVSTRGLIERRAIEADAATVPPMELERRVSTIGRLVTRVGGALIVVVAVLMALGQFSIDIGPAVAGLGVVGIAVGFGAQTLIRDWLAGIFVVLENQYSEGDVVRIAGVDGVVEDFSLRRTTLRDLDGTVHTVPNGHITVASNLTRLWARVNLDVSVAYDTDIDAATELINAVGREMQSDEEWGPRLLEAPVVARVNALADYAVTLKVLGQVRAAEQWAVAGELRKRILAAFGRAGVEIPFPRQVIVTRSGEAGPFGASSTSRGGGVDEGSAVADDPTAAVPPER